MRTKAEKTAKARKADEVSEAKQAGSADLLVAGGACVRRFAWPGDGKCVRKVMP